jgi:preprotein translocase subunit SecA
MDYLKEGIGLRAMAQRDPLVEYQREGYNMFADMMAGIREEAVQFLFNVEVRQAVAEPQAQAMPQGLTYTAPSEQGSATVRAEPQRPAPPAPKATPAPKKGQAGSSFFKG